MIIGKSGENLKKIGTQARLDIEALLGGKANLQCWVKVKEDWRNRAGQLREFGFN
jgi:GTP-binding protein Era